MTDETGYSDSGDCNDARPALTCSFCGAPLVQLPNGSWECSAALAMQRQAGEWAAYGKTMRRVARAEQEEGPKS